MTEAGNQVRGLDPPHAATSTSITSQVTTEITPSAAVPLAVSCRAVADGLLTSEDRYERVTVL
jgi:hypothetical protein